MIITSQPKERIYNTLLFTFLLAILISDRILTLVHFGFIYTDIDQLVMWNGASDYSHGVFHEPFFYGQAYNYMLESFLAIPLLWLKIPVFISLPIVTSVISLLPFIILAICFYQRKLYVWAYLCLAFPILMPLEYNFLTSISRGFVQAFVFIPFLFIPFFNPENKKNIIVLFIASGLCCISNTSSILIIIPVLIYVFSFQYKSPSFYLKSLLLLPFIAVDSLAKQFYVLHPEKVRHTLVGLKPNLETFFLSLKNTALFENLFPFFSNFFGGGWLTH